MIASIYFIVGLLFAVYVIVNLDERDKAWVLAPMCILLWPLFTIGIIIAAAIVTAHDIIKGE